MNACEGYWLDGTNMVTERMNVESPRTQKQKIIIANHYMNNNKNIYENDKAKKHMLKTVGVLLFPPSP